MFASFITLLILFFIIKYILAWIDYFNKLDDRLGDSLWRWSYDYHVIGERDISDLDDKDFVRRLHVKEGDKIIGGAEAFLILWSKMPKYRFLYKFFKLPIIFPIFNLLYELVAFFLYLKNKKQLKNY